MSLSLAAAAAAEPDAGWGRLVGLLVAVGVFYLGTIVHRRWVASRDGSSPTPALPGGASGAKPQINPGAGTDDTSLPEGVTVRTDQLDVSTSPLETWVGEQVGKRRTMEIVREAQRRFGASRRTVLRLVAKARGGNGAQS